MKEIAKKLLTPFPAPVFSYPVAKLLNIGIDELVTKPDCQAKVMSYIAENFNVSAVFNSMDLSVEAEAFGAQISFSACHIPEVLISIDNIREAIDIPVPELSQRCNVFVSGISQAKKQIANIPVIAGVTGPFSLLCRLHGMTETMEDCFDYPDEIHILLEKCSAFVKKYVLALKNAGADGVLVCEPAAGLLSPDMAEEFSFPYVSEIFTACDDDFISGYHNCGASVSKMSEQLKKLNADLYHFGNAVKMELLIGELENSVVAGNIDPIILKNGSDDEIKNAVAKIKQKYSGYSNFLFSTGCDLPPDTPVSNIVALSEYL